MSWTRQPRIRSNSLRAQPPNSAGRSRTLSIFPGKGHDRRIEAAAADAGQGGHNYLASVSDLVSAFIFVFIIMLAVFAYQLANVTRKQEERVEDLEAEEKTRTRMLRDIKRRLEKAGMRVEVLADQGVLRLSDNAINFPSGSEIPVPEHHANVGRLAQAIAEVVPCYVSPGRAASARTGGNEAFTSNGKTPSYCQPPADPDTYPCRKQEYPWLLETLLIEGHTDDVPVAPGNRFQDNLELSSMRAATVHRMIVVCEPGVERLFSTDDYPILSTSGYGYTRPATRDSVRTAENRRIDLRFLLEPPEGVLRTAEPEVQIDVRERYGEGTP